VLPKPLYGDRLANAIEQLHLRPSPTQFPANWQRFCRVKDWSLPRFWWGP